MEYTEFDIPALLLSMLQASNCTMYEENDVIDKKNVCCHCDNKHSSTPSEEEIGPIDERGETESDDDLWDDYEPEIREHEPSVKLAKQFIFFDNLVSWRNVNVIDKHRWDMAGQDAVLSCSHGILTLLLVGDGHGLNGHYWSLLATYVLKTLILEQYQFFVDNLNDNDKLSEKIHDIFRETDNEAHQTLREILGEALFRKGGTTISLVLVFEPVDAPKKVITAHLGDSPIMLVTREKTIMPELHNADVAEAYKEYVEYCLSKELEPKKAIYGRFNILGNQIEFPPGSGKYETIPIFDSDYNVIPENMDIVLTAAKKANRGFGTQSISNVGEAWQNFGSTIWSGSRFDGNPQSLKGIGDEADISPIPTISIHEFTEPVVVLVESDGPGDVIPYPELEKWMRSLMDNDENISQFDEMLERNLKTRDANGKLFYKYLPDDMSATVRHFP